MMDILILDTDLETLAIADDYISFIWTDRYREAGDFELYLPADSGILEFLQLGRYVQILQSDRLMVIESIECDTDAENGNTITITGRSLESLLDRRVVWELTELETDVQSAVKRILDENVLNPKDVNRQIKEFSFRTSDDEKLTTRQVNTSYFAQSVYDTIIGLCGYADAGFKVVPTDDKKFELSLFCGIDRSYDQDSLPWVAFSPNLDNLISSNFYASDTNYKTVCLAYWNGEEFITQESSREYTPAGSGLDRREMSEEIVDLGVEMEYSEDGLTDAQREQYSKIIFSKGREALYDCRVTDEFEGSLDTTRQYVYQRDFDIGDIVQVQNEYGMIATARLVELTRSSDASGDQTITTFEVV